VVVGCGIALAGAFGLSFAVALTLALPLALPLASLSTKLQGCKSVLVGLDSIPLLSLFNILFFV
jgi:hypothetical protein